MLKIFWFINRSNIDLNYEDFFCQEMVLILNNITTVLQGSYEHFIEKILESEIKFLVFETNCFYYELAGLIQKICDYTEIKCSIVHIEFRSVIPQFVYYLGSAELLTSSFHRDSLDVGLFADQVKDYTHLKEWLRFQGLKYCLLKVEEKPVVDKKFQEIILCGSKNFFWKIDQKSLIPQPQIWCSVSFWNLLRFDFFQGIRAFLMLLIRRFFN